MKQVGNRGIKVWLEDGIVGLLRNRATLEWGEQPQDTNLAVGQYLRQLAYRELGLCEPMPSSWSRVGQYDYQGWCRRVNSRMLHYYRDGKLVCGRVETTAGDFKRETNGLPRKHHYCSFCADKLATVRANSQSPTDETSRTG